MADKLQEGKFSQTSTRQKGIAIAVVVVILILIWQIIGIFSDQKPSPPPKTTSVKPAATQQAVTTSNAPAESDDLTHAKLVNEPSFIKMQKATEEKYVVKLNELEELRIQRQIAETNQAISAAKLATVTAEKNISDLLTKPTSAPVPQTIYSEELSAPSTVSVTPPPPVTSPIADYTLISVSMQLRKWTAVVGYQGKLITVNIGDSLPDNSTVVSINKNSIIIRKDGETKRIVIVSSI
jgi:hypothetical protein